MKKRTRFTLKQKILTLTVLPIIVIGIIVIVLSFTIVKKSLLKEIKEALQNAATATYAAYDQNAGEYMEAKNGDIWKGGYNISKSENIVDNIKEKTGVEVTFFYGDKRIMTSAKDNSGNRLLGSLAGEKIVQEVLKNGKEYFSQSVSIEGKLFYGYYIPIIQSSEKSPVGMIFAGADKAQKDAAVNKIIYSIIILIVASMLVCIAAAIVFSTSISNALKQSIGIVQSVSKGNLKTSINEKLLTRKDEVGDLSLAIKNLQEQMKKSLINIADNGRAVLKASDELEQTTRFTTMSMKEVEKAVRSIAESALSQAEISKTASENVGEMGKKIEQTSKEMEDMKNNTMAIQESEHKTSITLEKLLDSNDDVQKLIQEVAHQTKETNTSVQKIKEAATIIESIADETNLLSLNASIEAARAGEQGKGFAVVAGQIQKLALQSNKSSQQIQNVLRELTEDSDQAVKMMDVVIQKNMIQTEHMNRTQEMTKEVMNCINGSMDSLKVMESGIVYLNQVRQNIIDVMSKLSDIAKQNASTTQEVCADVDQTGKVFEDVEKNAEVLKNIADGLEVSVQHFEA